MVRLRAHGEMAVRVSDPVLFVNKVAGSRMFEGHARLLHAVEGGRWPLGRTSSAAEAGVVRARAEASASGAGCLSGGCRGA